MLTKKLGVLSFGELLPGHIDTVAGNEVLVVQLGSSSVLGGAKASDAWLRLDGNATVSVTFFDGTLTRGTHTFANTSTSLRRVAPQSGLFDRLEIRATSGRVALVGPNEALMLTLAGAQLPCAAGYERVGGACVDINECTGLNHACDSLTTCTNTPGSFVCGPCPQGYRGTGAMSCVDIDECADGSARCSALVACSNTPGSYRCGDCPAGYTGDGHSCSDINECAENLDRCDPLVACTNVAGSYECGVCPTGYVGGGSTGCVDIDECSGPNRACDALASCNNLPGGYECGACPNGYRGDGRSCADIDECADGSTACSPVVACGNTPGGYQCGACPSGYEGDGRTCFDIDECAVTPGPCAPGVTCTNSAGAFQCGSCPIGYRGDGRSCLDIDECETVRCAPDVTCANTEGSFRCAPCPSGFTGDGYSGCVDIDECTQELHDCSPIVTCGNTRGSYQCGECPQGYAGDGHTCIDVDECAERESLCDAGLTCMNTEGSHTCGECPVGYTGDAYACQDIDECVASPCDPLVWCTNQDGSYTCSECPSGYSGDGYAGCLDVDECATENGGCAEGEACVNEEGTYHCELECGEDDRTCDGRDDDCDGAVDDDYQGEGAPCGGPMCGGWVECVDGVVVVNCTPHQIDVPEECNNIDDDCNGVIDENTNGIRRCGLGACDVPGHFTCVDGHSSSDCPPPAPRDDTCDNVDEDCDGPRDEDYPVTQITCGTGACLASGVHFCDRGQLISRCTPRTPGPNDTVCNGIDDDCNGMADDDFVPQLTQCGTGACRAQGMRACVAGSVVDSCLPGAAAANDSSCNAVDDDCNGSVDEDFVPQATSCGAANCAGTGATSCAAGQVVDSCRPATTGPSDANCNGIDDDCDGTVDDNFAEQLVACQSAGCSGAGAIKCIGGVVTNTCETAPGCTRETACQDGQDNDGDGTADCQDQDCGYLPACFEDCNNGHDDDADGAADCLDDSCSGVAPCVGEICGNGLDDDGDLRPDCFDTDCASATGCGRVPADPTGSAPALENVPESSVLDSFAFLLEGTEPLQTGVTAALDRERTSLLTVHVTDTMGMPLPGVAVRVWNHPEFGVASTRADGSADLLLTGGQDVLVGFTGSGLLPVHRDVHIGWSGYATTDPVVMTPLDSSVTSATFQGDAPMQAIRGGINHDQRGTRQALLLIPEGITAQMTLADGSVRPLGMGNVRITEYTVGATGPAAMPAQLPANTAYTYAFEVSIDEAIAAGAKRVDLSGDLPLYVDNFVTVPPGNRIPFGYYDFDCGCWRPERDAMVVRIASVQDGAAELDVDGDGLSDQGPKLDSLGITFSERRRLAELYTPGKVLWRMRISHFTPYDCNFFQTNLPEDSQDPPKPPDLVLGDPIDQQEQEEDCHASGSIISCSNRDLGESLPIAGTPYRLNYTSAIARRARSYVRVPISPDQLSPALLRIEATIEVAGQRIKQVFPPAPSQWLDFDWDGFDRFHRPLPPGVSVKANLTICNVYRSVISGPAGFTFDDTRSFLMLPSGEVVSPDPISNFAEMDRCVNYQVTLRQPERELWKVDVLASADNASKTLRLGGIETDRVDAEPTATRLPWTLTGTVAEFDLVSVLGDGTTIIRDCVTDRTDGNLSAVGHGESPVVGDSRPRARVGMCLRQLEHSSLGCNLATALTFGSLTEPVFTPDGSHVYLYSFDNHGVARFKVEHSVTVDNLPRVRFVEGEFVIGGLPGEPGASGPRLNDVAANVVNDVRGYRLDMPASSMCSANNHSEGRTDMAAATDGSLYLLAPLDVRPLSGNSPPLGERRALWRITMGGGAQRIPVPELEDSSTWRHEAYLSPISGPDGSLFLRLADGHGQYLDKIKWLWIQSNGTVRTLYGTQACNPAINYCEWGSAFYDASLDRLWVMRKGKPWPPKLTIVTIDYRRYAEAGGVSYDTTEASPVLYRMVEQDGNEDPGTISVQYPFMARMRDWMLLPDGRVRVLSEPTMVGPSGKVTVLGYSGVIDLSTRAVASSKSGSAYTFSAGGLLAETRDPLTLDLLRFYDYDAQRNVIGIVDASGNRTRIERDSKGLMTAIVGPYGHRTSFAYDGAARISALTDPMGRTTSFTYHRETPLLTSLTNPLGHTSRFEYDEASRLRADTDATGGVQDLTSLENNQTEHTVRYTDGDGFATLFETSTDPRAGDALRVTRADGTHSTRILSDDETRRTVVSSDGTSITTTYAPDPFWGAQAPYASDTSIVTPAGRKLTLRTARNVLVNASNVVTGYVETTSAGTASLEMTHDRVTRTRSFRSAEGRTAQIIYDAAGRPVSRAIADELPTVLSYDARGRVATITRGTRSASVTYDESGNLATTTAPSGRIAFMERDGLGYPLSMETAGTGIEVHYDAAHQPVRITAAGADHLFAYNDAGFLSGYTAPQSFADSLLYSPGRRVMRRSLPDGRTIENIYDSTGRVATVNAPGGTYGYGYDSTGKLSAITAPGENRLSVTWDGPLLLSYAWGSSAAVPKGPTATVGFGYDALLRPTSIVLNGQTLETSTFDKDDLLTRKQVAHPTLGTLGNLVLTRSAGTGRISGTQFGQLASTQTYNGYGEMSEVAFTHASNALFSKSNLQYDPDGRVISEDETILGEPTHREYAYDGAGRLENVWEDDDLVEHFMFDTHGNRIARTAPGGSETGTYDAAGRLVSYGGFIYAFDANGFLRTKTNNATSEMWTYTYDEFGALKQVQLPAGTVVSYEVDPLGRRVGRSVNGTLDRRWVYTGHLHPLAELDAAGQVTTRFVYADRGNVPALMIRGTQVYRLIADSRGSVRLVINASTGAVAQRLDYDSFGRVLVDTAPGFQPFGFAGGIYDAETKLVRFGARDYDPYTGRWTARDPALFGGGQANLYAYARNDPVNFIDMTGLEPASVMGAYDAGYFSWIHNRDDRFNQFGIVNNARYLFGDENAPVCLDYAEDLADYLNENFGQPGHQAEVAGKHEIGDHPSHFTVEIKNSSSGDIVGDFDPWLDPFWWAVP